MVERTSFASSVSLQNNECHPSFHCGCALVLAVLCAAKLWEPQISKRNEGLSVGPGLWLSLRCHHLVLALELSSPSLV